MKVKRILSSILATVMVATSLVAVNVSNVWASNVVESSTKKVWTFTGYTSAETKSVSASDDATKPNDIEGIIVTKNKISIKYESETGLFSVPNGSTIGLPVPAGSNGTISMVCNKELDPVTKPKDSDQRYLTLSNSKKIYYVTDKNANYETYGKATYVAADINEDGYITMTATNEMKIYSITVTLGADSENDFGEPDKVYTMSGICTGLKTGDTFGLYQGDVLAYTATVTDGSFSFEHKTAPSGEYTVKKTGYTVSGGEAVSFAFNPSDSLKYTASTPIEFNVMELKALEEKTYTDNGIFADPTAFKYDSGYNSSNKKFKGSLKFKLDSAKTVTVSGRSGSTSGSAKFSIVDDNGLTYTSKEYPKLESGVDTTTTIEVTLPMGTYSLVVANKDSYVESIKAASATAAKSDFEVTVKSVASGHLVLGKFTGVLDDYTKVGILLSSKNDGVFGQNVSSETLYERVEIDSESFADGPYFAALVTGVPSGSSLYAAGYTTDAKGISVRQATVNG